MREPRKMVGTAAYVGAQEIVPQSVHPPVPPPGEGLLHPQTASRSFSVKAVSLPLTVFFAFRLWSNVSLSAVAPWHLEEDNATRQTLCATFEGASPGHSTL